MASELHYIRVKRGTQTIFVQVEAADTGFEVKRKIESMTDWAPDSQKLFINKALIEDAKKIIDQKVENDSVVQVRLRAGEDWEPLDPPEAEEADAGAP